MSRIAIAVAPRPYDVVIENGLLEQSGRHLREVLGKRERLFVVTVAPVRKKWGKKLMAALSAAGFAPKLVEMPDGERHKKITTVEGLAEKLSKLGADRGAAVLAFGGGVVGDVTGLLASIYMRGLDFVQIPTTVLAQVDASIGGKTGVNLGAGKNLLGTFHQPRVVLVDPDLLASLPEREFRSGLYESLKCGVIGRPGLFNVLEKNDVGTIRRDAAKLRAVIEESVKFKAEVVSSDEREQGRRQVLNFGHTIGHALEAETGYKHFLHGEAIAWGMIAAAYIAAAVGQCDEDTASRIVDAVFEMGPLPPVRVHGRSILRRLQSDKKTVNGVVYFILPAEIGRVEIVKGVPDKIVIAAVDELRKFSI